jgi:hypothetical protein
MNSPRCLVLLCGSRADQLDHTRDGHSVPGEVGSTRHVLAHEPQPAGGTLGNAALYGLPPRDELLLSWQITELESLFFASEFLERRIIGTRVEAIHLANSSTQYPGFPTIESGDTLPGWISQV